MKLSPPDLASLQHICRNLRERDRLEVEASEGDFDPDQIAHRVLAAWRACGAFGQIVGRDEPIAVMTLIRISPRAVGATLLATDRWREIVRPYARHCERTLKPKLIAEGVRRIEARAWEEHKDSRRWLTWLGAKEECRIPQWGRNGETFIQYGWTADVHEQAEGVILAGAGGEPSVHHRHDDGAAG